MLARLCSKSFKLGFSNTWTENFQMYKLGFEEAEEPEIKLSTFDARKQENSRKTSTSASLITLKSLMVRITTNWKILKEMGIPDHLTCLLRNLCGHQEATDWFKIGKGAGQGCMLSLCLFNLYAEYLMGNTRLDEKQAGIRIAARNINKFRYADDIILIGLPMWRFW